MLKTLASFTLVIALFWNPHSHAAECGQAQVLFEKGLAAGKAEDWSEARAYLEKSTSTCGRFENWYLLGRTELELENYYDAAAAFVEARRSAKNQEQVALSVARYSQTQYRLGFLAEASTLIHDARALHSEEPEWMTELSKEIDLKLAKEPLRLAQVTRALSFLPPKGFSPVKPTYPMRVNFEFDSTDLMAPERFDRDILVEALSSELLNGKEFIIIGHSDVRGEGEYNFELSKKRADQIRNQIIERNPELSGRIRSEGAGESRPLYKGRSEEEHMLNRRIEIQVN